MSETLKIFLMYVIPALLLSVPGIYAAIMQLRLSKSQNKLQNGGASDSFATAATKVAELNTKYLAKISELETRLEAVEEEKSYRIIVEFKTSTPPIVGEVMIEPILNKP